MRQGAGAQNPSAVAQVTKDVPNELGRNDWNSRFGVESMHHRCSARLGEGDRGLDGTGGDHRPGFRVVNIAGIIEGVRGLAGSCLVGSVHTIRVVGRGGARVDKEWMGRWWSCKER
ncbi:hypothetical protein FOMPIDRAFT_1054908 [Fomitopsis schrenkii]|uniref:Uncharacterized protein n=1 Tax=Fomitopsis schrenkii TaxID=2126942 RepID=S8DMB9_FOMSC|nr:hypothetical protein FOMPIDRAFT_1054908 [Fomitopsis schrenkii]